MNKILRFSVVVLACFSLSACLQNGEGGFSFPKPDSNASSAHKNNKKGRRAEPPKVSSTKKNEPKDIVKTWVGREIGDLIAVYGPPASIIDLPKKEKVYSFSYSKTRTGGGGLSSLMRGFGGNHTMANLLDDRGDTYTDSCTINFKANRNGIIKLATISQDSGGAFGSDCDKLAKAAP